MLAVYTAASFFPSHSPDPSTSEAGGLKVSVHEGQECCTLEVEYKLLLASGWLQCGAHVRMFHVSGVDGSGRPRRVAAVFLSDACPCFALEVMDAGFRVWACCMPHADCVLLEALTPLLSLHDFYPQARAPCPPPPTPFLAARLQ